MAYNKDTKPRHNLQLDIIRRFLKGDELETFLKEYQESRKGGPGLWNRKNALEAPITKQDLTLVQRYMLEPEVTTTEIGQSLGLTPGNVYNRVLRTCVKIVAQHPEILEKVTIDG